MEFEDHEEQNDQEMEIPMAPPGYDSLGNSASRSTKIGVEGTTSSAARKSAATTATPIKYRECLKNHAVGIGGHALDGCGEFMAAGEEGSLDALKCAACNCHRNFHRKETDGDQNPYQHQQHIHHPQFSSYYRSPPPSGYLHLTPAHHHRPLALPAASGGGGGGGGGHSREEGEDVSNPSSSGGGGSGSGLRKRFRTKFTQEQKEKMLDFSEKLGWRIQKHDESAVEQFCAETGVSRQVLKVWMHNNKHTLDFHRRNWS